jgi:hypothetical protein
MAPDALQTATTTPAGPGTPELELRPHARTRVLAAIALTGLLSSLGYAGFTAYHAINDSFVAPIILSPDNDLVIQSKLSLSRLQAERRTIDARIDENEAAADAAEASVARLEDFQRSASRALDWSMELTAKQESLGERDLQRIAEQEALVDGMTAHQKDVVAATEKNVAAGLTHKADLEREQQTLDQLRLTALQSERERVATEIQLHAASLAQKALHGGRGRLATPEMVGRQDQLVRVELDLLKLKAELATKRSLVRADRDELAKIDELVTQMKSRPIFRAIEGNQNVAFVPYTQIDGVHAGAAVYHCAVWGVFSCDPVGKVAELLPGEVAMQDPWGTPMRGQYALLDLSHPEAAQAKVLRVRGPGDAAAAPAGPGSTTEVASRR